ncbi:MAG: phosphoribosylanthranilate isomerase [Gemmatimonadetes bacterium]|nr:phosphoribosylanthranilate isomerase [Gemmatimonadota bacterium]MYA76948.1 phosphoribosylanthranilate isomerase [Gemmatimonadota bacterium]MYG14928.1 phosphoribosylanthranilate isomerase [Gemmatimonadota bacterium]MYH19687.1 phosphoribosylanthranilate isomerase [Gemmatimonadota bacterium]MYK99069.1 phosphoribosylanthranilate isomerase [Gemmatimonadota bacterium]
MSTVRIKICGITNEGDAAAAVRAGADALGFIFYTGSPRYVAPERAAEIVAGLPPFVVPVGVFVNAAAGDVDEICEAAGIQVVQLHGDEPPGFCDAMKRPVIKAFRVRDASWKSDAAAYPVGAVLLDTFAEDRYGGTGTTFDWRFVEDSPHRVILSGGLNPDNVAEAVRSVRPYGVDTGSGVEREPGRKDHGKIRDFVEAARRTL